MENDKKAMAIADVLKSHPEGLTITDVMRLTGLARHTVLARLYFLMGKGDVGVRKFNMAKVHHWKGKNEEKAEDEKIKVVELKEEHIKPKPQIVDLTEEKVKPKVEPVLAKQEISETKSKVETFKTSDGKIKKRVKVDMASIKAEIRAALEKELNSSSIGDENFSQTQIRAIDKLDVKSLKDNIRQSISDGELEKHEGQIKEQRDIINHVIDNTVQNEKQIETEGRIRTYVPGFDELMEGGIPKGSAILVAGGAGSGKTILTTQILMNHAIRGEKCLMMSFEESKERLIDHLESFGWNPKELIEKGFLSIQRFNPYDITRSVEALLMKAKGELLIDVDPIIFPPDFVPDIIVVDSLTAIASAFTKNEDSYRIYIEQLFRFFEKVGATSFLITETEQIPTVFSTEGVEEFLADGVFVIYNFKRGNVRENGIEVLKLRGTKHQKKIVAMKVTNRGIIVYPKQEVYSG